MFTFPIVIAYDDRPDANFHETYSFFASLKKATKKEKNKTIENEITKTSKQKTKQQPYDHTQLDRRQYGNLERKKKTFKFIV